MILNRFPGAKGINIEDDEIYARLYQENTIFHAYSNYVAYKLHSGPLSIKCVFKGREAYEVNSVPYAVEPSNFLVLNHMQSYASEIDSNEQSESFCLFFRSGFANEVLSGHLKQSDYLLDNPDFFHEQPLLFFQKLYQHDKTLTPIFQQIHCNSKAGITTQSWIDEQFYAIILGLLTKHRLISEEIEKLPALKHTTRVELYRRLHTAKDFMDSCFTQNLKLTEIARTACLSQFHFLRIFKQVFQLTPHKYITQKRLQAAQRLLRQTDDPITEISLTLGFDNPAVFSRAYKNHFNTSPSQERLLPN